MKTLNLKNLSNENLSIEISNIKEVAPHMIRRREYAKIKLKTGEEIIVKKDYTELMDIIIDAGSC